ncbi:MAG: ABC transporter substrate-binding protein [Pseudomonadota bacterium]
MRAAAVAWSLLILLLSTTMLDQAQARTLRWTMASDAAGVDPHMAADNATTLLVHQIYEGLSRFDENHVPVPHLARGWSVDETGLTWRFFLRTGIRFHDGRRLRADDVVFSIQRARAELSTWTADLSHVEEVVASNDLVVKMVTSRPDALLPARLAAVKIVSRDWVIEQERAVGLLDPGYPGDEALPSWQAMNSANGTGPYKLIDRVPGKLTALVASPTYWGATPENGSAFKRLEFHPLASAESRMAALGDGSVDLVLDPLADAIDTLKGRRTTRTVNSERAVSVLLGFNVSPTDDDGDSQASANPFADKRVRQAIALAVDAEAMRNVILKRRSLPSAMPVAPNVFGWSEELDSRQGVDLDLAKELLAEAGYADGFSPTLHCPMNGYLGHEAICRAIVGMLAQVDISVTLQRRSLDDHLATLRDDKPTFYLLPWSTTTFDSRQALESLYHSADGTYGTSNFTGFADADLDVRIKALSATFDRAEAEKDVIAAWQEATDALIYVPLHHQIDTWVARRAFRVDADGAGLPAFSDAKFTSPSADLEEAGIPPTGP